MKQSAIDELVGRSHIFQRLDADGRERLARVAKEVEFTPGEVIVREGEQGDAFYAILSGVVGVTADDFGTPREVAQLEAGAVCGEIAALTREPRTATLTAKTEVRMLRFERVGVLAVLKDFPDVLAELNRLGVMRSEALLEQLGS